MTRDPDSLMPTLPVAPSAEKRYNGPEGMGAHDFWVWSPGELRDSAAGGVVPEFFVARAVCAEAPHRVGWTSYDVETPAGVRSE